MRDRLSACGSPAAGGTRPDSPGAKDSAARGVSAGVGTISMAERSMHTHRQQRINERLDADTAVCALGAVALWSVLIVLYLPVPPV
jgi:hypothetical protein